jgi:hypothetical protein
MEAYYFHIRDNLGVVEDTELLSDLADHVRSCSKKKAVQRAAFGLISAEEELSGPYGPCWYL